MPASTIAEIAGITRQLHSQWASKGMVRQPGHDGCDEFDLIELTVLRALIADLGPEEARIAWTQVRGALKSRLPTGQLDVIYDSQRKLAKLATSSIEVADGVRHGRPVRVLPLEEVLAINRDAFRRAIDGIASRGRAPAQARRLRA